VLQVTRGLATASNWETEGAKGKTFVTLNGDLMSLYMAKYGVAAEKFAPFPINAHRNAGTSEHATLRKPVTEEGYAESRVLTDPIRIMDASPTCDGAAAVVLTSSRAIAQRPGAVFVRIAGSGAASDVLPVHERPDPLHLRAVEQSLSEALRRARLTHGDVDLFELHDAYSIMACLCLESAGFVQAGEGTAFAQDGNLGLRGVLPIATFGGLKARGHPVGATGVYQAAEMLLQLNGRAGENQVRGAQVGVVQNIGGAGGSVYTHVMVREG
jgi:acetyl-CoA C-acetyltransferase